MFVEQGHLFIIDIHMYCDNDDNDNNNNNDNGNGNDEDNNFLDWSNSSHEVDFGVVVVWILSWFGHHSQQRITSYLVIHLYFC